MMRPNNDIPPGAIQFYDNYVPGLEAGQWHIRVNQTLLHDQQPVSDDKLEAGQEFSVRAPQFFLDSSEIAAQYPPDGSAGRYGEVLPHVVFREPALPWERGMQDKSNRQPWLALLVLEENELLGGEDSTTRAINTRVGDFLRLNSVQAEGRGHPLIIPDLVKEADVDDSQSCRYIQIPARVFLELSPRLNELRYLAHCRRINTGDQAQEGINENGLHSLVMANRFPAVPRDGDRPVKNLVHLVSLEGMDKYLVDHPSWEWDGRDPDSEPFLALISLYSWSFQVLTDHNRDFHGLIRTIVNSGTEDGRYEPQKLWLRLPLPDFKSGDPGRAEVTKRIANGFAPLAYHTRTGEESFAWYRGPLVPLLTAPLQKSQPFLSADAAVIYQAEYGVFDLSLAAAWEIGRALALADRGFGQKLQAYRNRAGRLTDQLQYRLQSRFFRQDRIAGLAHDATVQDEFSSIWTGNCSRPSASLSTTAGWFRRRSPIGKKLIIKRF